MTLEIKAQSSAFISPAGLHSDVVEVKITWPRPRPGPQAKDRTLGAEAKDSQLDDRGQGQRCGHVTRLKWNLERFSKFRE